MKYQSNFDFFITRKTFRLIFFTKSVSLLQLTQNKGGFSIKIESQRSMLIPIEIETKLSKLSYFCNINKVRLYVISLLIRVSISIRNPLIAQLFLFYKNSYAIYLISSYFDRKFPLKVSIYVHRIIYCFFEMVVRSVPLLLPHHQ